MKSKKPYLYFIAVILTLLLVFGIMSCKIDGKKSEEETKQVSGGVISLLDSLGVGDVSGYPGANYDKELNDQLGEFRNQLEIPAEFINVLYSVYVTNDTPLEVVSFYNSELKELQWGKSLDLTSDKAILWSGKKLQIEAQIFLI